MISNNQSQRPLDIFIRILLVSLLIAWCFLIARPFLVIIIWAVIIAVAVNPIYERFVKLFWGKRSLAIGVFVLLMLVLVAWPSIKISRTLVNHSSDIAEFIQDPNLQIPPPNDNVQDWPVVGKELHKLWTDASGSLEDFLQQHSETVTNVLGWIISGLGGVLTDAFISIFSLLIAALLLYNSKTMYEGTLRFATRLIGDGGLNYVKTARDTIKSVVQGIILIALIQAILAFVGFELVGMPAPALFAILILILAVVQLPVILVTLPSAIYMFTVAETTAAVIFAIYIMLIGLLDNVLKPIFLGRGLNVPMIIILIGSLGGLVLHGILGLFVGPVVMAIGYQTYELWIADSLIDSENEQQQVV